MRQINSSQITGAKVSLEVEKDWAWLSIDVTHIPKAGVSREVPYLTVVHCRPAVLLCGGVSGMNRFCSVCEQLKNSFLVGKPEELMLNNYSTYRSKKVTKLLKSWSLGSFSLHSQIG